MLNNIDELFVYYINDYLHMFGILSSLNDFNDQTDTILVK